LPIDESSEPKGRGAFGEVWCFTFRDHDYLSDIFKKEVCFRFQFSITILMHLDPGEQICPQDLYRTFRERGWRVVVERVVQSVGNVQKSTA
jgi:hypothetical protein